MGARIRTGAQSALGQYDRARPRLRHIRDDVPGPHSCASGPAGSLRRARPTDVLEEGGYEAATAEEGTYGPGLRRTRTLRPLALRPASTPERELTASSGWTAAYLRTAVSLDGGAGGLDAGLSCRGRAEHRAGEMGDAVSGVGEDGGGSHVVVEPLVMSGFIAVMVSIRACQSVLVVRVSVPARPEGGAPRLRATQRLRRGRAACRRSGCPRRGTPRP